MELTNVNNYSYYEKSNVIRPGTICLVTLTYRMECYYEFDSSISQNFLIEGYTEKTGLVFDKLVELNKVTIIYNKDDNTSNIIIEPLNLGTVKISYYKINRRQSLSKSFSAFSNKLYYNFYNIENNTVVPCTIIEYNMPPIYYKIDSVIIDPIVEFRGIDYKDGIEYKIDNQGILQYTEDNIVKKELLLTKGIQYIKIHKDFYNGPYIQVEDDMLLVKYQNNEWLDDYITTGGLLFYDSYILVTTNNGLCVFDRFNCSGSPLFVDTTIHSIGDLTVDEYDNLYITRKNKIRKYHIRHDMSYKVEDERRIYFREKVPFFTLNIK